MKKDMLMRLGLNKNEAETYLLLLKKGELSPIEVASLTDLKRQNAYAVLASLEKKGLTKKDERHNKFQYLPNDPAKLSEICHEQLRSMSETSDRLDMAMPELLSFYNLAKDRPGISYFKGIEGVKRLYEDTLDRKPRELLLILSEKKKNTYIDLWLKKQYAPKRIEAGISQREILNNLKECTSRQKKEALWEQRCVVMPSMPKNIDILIYDDNVTFINYSKKEPVGFTVDDNLFYFAIEALFVALWDRA